MFLALSFLLACFDPDSPASDDSSTLVFEVEKGTTANQLQPELTELGLAPSGISWKLYTRNHDVGCLKAGRFELRRDMSLNEVFETLCGAPLPDDKPFTVVEGWRIREIDAALTEQGWIQAGEYATLARSKAVDLPFDVQGDTLEGYLWPETYMLSPSRFSAKAFIERQLETFQTQFLVVHAEAVKERGLHDVVVMASLLEREEPTPKQRPLVAGILWKRLDKGWQLGVDATSRYTLKDWNDRKAFLKQLRDPDDPYNTRLRKGLPPTAIGNASLNALEAALNPESSEYWFYLHDKQRVLHPARNADEHEANRRRYNVY